MNRKVFPASECPSFISCSAPKCPLDPDIAIRVSVKGDEKCKAGKPGRQRIAAKYPELLPFGGLFKKQFVSRLSAIKRWESLTEVERVAQREKMLQIGLKSKKSKKTAI